MVVEAVGVVEAAGTVMVAVVVVAVEVVMVRQVPAGNQSWHTALLEKRSHAASTQDIRVQFRRRW